MNNQRTASNASLFLVGMDSHGKWVVQGQDGLCGGLFISEADALKFALAESGNRPHAVIAVSGVLELDMSARPATGRRKGRATTPLRRVA